MASTQQGTGGLTAAGQAALAATYITVPANVIVESVNVSPGGTVDKEDVGDEDGAFHTRFTYEKGMHSAVIVLKGIAYAGTTGDLDGSGSDYYVESCPAETTKGPLRTTVTVTHLPTVT